MMAITAEEADLGPDGRPNPSSDDSDGGGSGTLPRSVDGPVLTADRDLEHEHHAPYVSFPDAGGGAMLKGAPCGCPPPHLMLSAFTMSPPPPRRLPSRTHMADTLHPSAMVVGFDDLVHAVGRVAREQVKWTKVRREAHYGYGASRVS